MKKIYHLSTCNTCQRILGELEPDSSYEITDVKNNTISEAELAALYERSGSYEALFNRRAKMYQERDLKNANLSEVDYKNLLLEHYTFLKRPVVINNDRIFVGNSKKVIAAAKEIML